MVEKRIASEMEGTTGALVYDGWTDTGTNYVAVYASYMKFMTVNDNGISKQVPKLHHSLLSVSTMGNKVSRSDASHDEEEATNFNAETHLEFFETRLSYYNLQLSEWCKCFIGDNESTCLRVAKIAKKLTSGATYTNFNLK